MELIGKKFTRKDRTFVEDLLKSTTVYTIEESKKKGVLVVRWDKDGESAHTTCSIKEAEKNVKKGKWVLQP